MYRFLIAFIKSTSVQNVTSRESFEWDGRKIVRFIGNETHVVIPQGATEIKRNAFFDCPDVKAVTIPQGVRKIQSGAFRKCPFLKAVDIPDSIRNIGTRAFEECPALKEWSISQTHPVYKSDGPALLSKDGKKLIACLDTTEYTIPAGVTEIMQYAFTSCESLISVFIPEEVKHIRKSAFRNCTSLTSVFFRQSHWLSDELKTLCNSHIELIPGYVFETQEPLTSIFLPDFRVTFGDKVFTDCPNLTIYGPVWSKVKKYAEENEIPFVVKY